MSTPVILVSGAAGKTGSAVVRALVRRGARVRTLVRRPEQLQLTQALGATGGAAGDMRDSSVWNQALLGVDSVYHICPNMHPDEPAIGDLALRSAREANVGHFVYHSVLHPQIESMPHHWKKMQVEAQIFEAGVPYTILQPAAYMQNVLAGWDSIACDGIYRTPYAEETRLGMVDLHDVAEAAATVLTEPGHVGATYELGGPGVLSGWELAAILSEQIGREVRVETVPLDVWERQARSSGLSEYTLQTLVGMFRYYEEHGFWGNSRVLRMLIGRPATSFAEFVARQKLLSRRLRPYR